jgi:hypothetical protein
MFPRDLRSLGHIDVLPSWYRELEGIYTGDSSAAASLVEQFERRKGYLHEGNDLAKGTASLADAITYCVHAAGCVGFTLFNGSDVAELAEAETKYKVYFKSASDGSFDSSSDWVSFVRSRNTNKATQQHHDSALREKVAGTLQANFSVCALVRSHASKMRSAHATSTAGGVEGGGGAGLTGGGAGGAEGSGGPGDAKGDSKAGTEGSESTGGSGTSADKGSCTASGESSSCSGVEQVVHERDEAAVVVTGAELVAELYLQFRLNARDFAQTAEVLRGVCESFVGRSRRWRSTATTATTTTTATSSTSSHRKNQGGTKDKGGEEEAESQSTRANKTSGSFATWLDRFGLDCRVGGLELGGDAGMRMPNGDAEVVSGIGKDIGTSGARDSSGTSTADAGAADIAGADDHATSSASHATAAASSEFLMLDISHPFLKVYRLPTLMSAAAVDQVLALTNSHTEAHGWTTRRHDSYPTTDVPVGAVGGLHDFLISSGYYDRLMGALAALYELPSPDWLRLDDHFVVKYEAAAGKQDSLSSHRDGSEFTLLSYHVVLSHEVRFVM